MPKNLPIRAAALILTIAALSACTSVEVLAPNPQVEPPEIRGDRGLIIDVDGGGAHTYKATQDAAARPPNMTEPSVKRDGIVSSSVLYSPVEPIALGLELSPMLQGANGVAKFQLNGEGSRASAIGDLPIGAYVRLGTTKNQAHGSGDQLFGADLGRWSGEINSYYAMAGLSIGYRMAPHALVYAGGAFGHYLVKTKVSQDAHDTDPGGSYSVSDTGNAMTAGVGAQFNWKYVLFFVGGDYTDIRYKSAGGVGTLYGRAGISINPM
jgi:hypothetical protein